jgi:pyruvate-formate lyase-activating enzyme
MTPQQLWHEIQPYSAFLSGVTVSGGEPAQQMEFLVAFLCVVKQSSDLSTFIETNGFASTEDLHKLLPVLDGALIDLPAMDPDVHRRLTGQDNSVVKQTLRFLAGHGKAHTVRVTVVPEFNDTIENAVATARFMVEIDRRIGLRFQRFRAHGTRGVAETWESPADEVMNQLVQAARTEGLLNVSRSI